MLDIICMLTAAISNVKKKRCKESGWLGGQRECVCLCGRASRSTGKNYGRCWIFYFNLSIREKGGKNERNVQTEREKNKVTADERKTRCTSTIKCMDCK